MNSENRLRISRERFGLKAGIDLSVVALAGNPNVGKSTVFNKLTGLHQHTGNWPGKTIQSAQGSFSYKGRPFLLVDLPGTYSLLAHTPEEEIARDFICFGRPDVTLVVLDATCLERNLNLALQVIEITPNAVICVNLMDEARKKKIHIDIPLLEQELGVPVVAASARNGEGLSDIREALYQIITKERITMPRQIQYSSDIENAVQQLLPELNHLDIFTLSPRWVALRLLDSDKSLLDSITSYLNLETECWREAGASV
ncbi:MAG: iron transporter FeoB [Syntrophomonadaceae bacterium]|nr:iron transporter FeoB [Syntrophomonadaceae bacterium]